MASDNSKNNNNSELPPGFVRYQHELPEWERISKAWNLLEKYSGIPPEQIEPHLRAIVCFVPIFTCLHLILTLFCVRCYYYLIPYLPYSFLHSLTHSLIRPSKSDDGA